MPRKLFAKLALMMLLVAGAILSVPGTSEAFPCYCDDGTYVGDFSTVRACANACYPPG
jgi:hypothetical protein